MIFPNTSWYCYHVFIMSFLVRKLTKFPDKFQLCLPGFESVLVCLFTLRELRKLNYFEERMTLKSIVNVVFGLLNEKRNLEIFESFLGRFIHFLYYSIFNYKNSQSNMTFIWAGSKVNTKKSIL